MKWALVFVQQFCIGLVTRMIVNGDFLLVVLVAYLQTLVWWSNIGVRMQHGQSRWAAHAYAAISALGVAGGAWFWSRF